MKKISKKDYRILGTGVVFVKAQTDENEIIVGGSLYLFGFQTLTVAIANKPWVNEKGQVMNFERQGSVLFIRKVVLDVGRG